MEFVITDLMTDILVSLGSLPDFFREGHSVVVDGFVKPFTNNIKEISTGGKTKEVTEKAWSGDCYFSASEAGEVAAAVEKNKKRLDEEAEAEAEAKKTAVT